jgi:hypothetical protein
MPATAAGLHLVAKKITGNLMVSIIFGEEDGCLWTAGMPTKVMIKNYHGDTKVTELHGEKGRNCTVGAMTA